MGAQLLSDQSEASSFLHSRPCGGGPGRSGCPMSGSEPSASCTSEPPTPVHGSPGRKGCPMLVRDPSACCPSASYAFEAPTPSGGSIPAPRIQYHATQSIY